MKPPRFGYSRPTSIAEAVTALASENSKVLAGGQSLTPLLSMRLASPGSLVDINSIPELRKIEFREGLLWLGATARHEEVRRHPLVSEHVPLLCQALGYVAHEVIRNRGTSVGSIAHADPAGELTAVAVLLEAKINVIGSRGSRVIEAKDFFTGPLESSLKHGEMILGVDFPAMAKGWGSACEEVSRRHGDYALAGVCALVSHSPEAVRVALFSVGSVPIALDLGDHMSGETLKDSGVEFVQSKIDPEGDIHATMDYRRSLVTTLLHRAIKSAFVNSEVRT